MLHHRLRLIQWMIALFFLPIMGQSQTLVWADNFDSTINPNVWTYDFGDGCERSLCGWGNSELEYYTSRQENVRIENGNLVIEARKETFGASAFTSGRIKTEGRVHFQYGTLEARIKVPNISNGLWPALWTLGTVGGVWPTIGEIDILEMGAQAALQANLGNKRVSSAVHWNNGGPKSDTVSTFDSPNDLSADYHLYKMVWNSTTINMYIDNQMYFSFNINPAIYPKRKAFHTPHFILLNLAVGGAYPGIFATAGITAPLPGKMYVDYVRLYQQPTDSLFIGTQNAPAGNFGVFTETTAISDSIVIGKDATLNYWNNLTNIAGAAAAEGNQVLAVHANANDWFGWGIDNRYVNLSNYTTGSLVFRFKTSYGGQFKVGITSGHGQSWINFPAGSQQFGLVRDGNWHTVTIPLSEFNNSALGRNIDLFSIKSAMLFAGDPATAAADFYFDDIYFKGGISPNPPPMVAITTPSPQAIFPTASTINIAANATDTNGTVQQVAFYSGGTLLGIDTSSPYSYQWTNPTVGIDTLLAVATDNQGATSSSLPVIIFVAPASNLAPNIQITTPANDTTAFTPANIVVSAQASDADGSIYKVAFFADSLLIGEVTTAPYQVNWASNAVGNHHLSAIATDNGGKTTTSTAVLVHLLQPVAPTVSITYPSNNSSFVPPANFTILVNAADANGSVVSVAYYNGTTLLGTATTSPFSMPLTNLALGNYAITAVATDNDGNTTTSSVINISVAPVACTGVAASGDYSYEVFSYGSNVYFTFHPLSPITGSTGAIIYLKQAGSSGAYAGYNMVASGSDFTFQTAVSAGTSLSFYFSYKVPSTGGENNSSNNPHQYVVGTVCVAGAPNVTIDSPADAASFTAPANIVVQATASTSLGSITSVSFYAGGTLVGVDSTNPYQTTWSGVAAGNYALTAQATSSNGLSTTSIPVNIVVVAPNTNGYCGTAFNKDYEYKATTNGGSVTFTFHPLSPITGCAYVILYLKVGTTGGYAGYNMAASGPDFLFTTSIATGASISYYFTYQVPSGGERNSSANPHSYMVGDNCTGLTGIAPTIYITSPTTGATFTEPANITIATNAADADGTVSNVVFFNGANSIGTVTAAPFEYNWTNVPAGNYVLSAKATDNVGLFTVSSLVKVVVGIDHSMGFCGTLSNGDYSYRIEKMNGKVVFTFHPLTPIQGCAYVLIYVREGNTGGYPGYQMVAVGNDFRFTKTIADSVPLSVYFTYQVPTGGERNSSATPHSYTVGAICTTPLPVKLIRFNAMLTHNNQVQLNWVTADEINNHHFVLFKSIDGKQFTAFASIAANKERGVYAYLDTAILRSGNCFYRLMQVDKDGHQQVLQTVKVLRENSNRVIQMTPNPLKGNMLTLYFGQSRNLNHQITIINASGKTVFANSLPQQGTLLQIHLEHPLAQGQYFLRIDQEAALALQIQ